MPGFAAATGLKWIRLRSLICRIYAASVLGHCAEARRRELGKFAGRERALEECRGVVLLWWIDTGRAFPAHRAAESDVCSKERGDCERGRVRKDTRRLPDDGDETNRRDVAPDLQRALRPFCAAVLGGFRVTLEGAERQICTRESSDRLACRQRRLSQDQA